MENIYYPSADNKTQIHAVIWRPQGEVKAVLQIIHGMAEYAERYAPFAKYLTERGIAVVAEDHLGHGKSVNSPEDLGFFAEGEPEKVVLQDIRQLTEKAKEMFPQKPYFLMGHSMGSFFCRKYIGEFHDLNGAIIMGTGFMSNAILNIARLLVKSLAANEGWDSKNALIDNIAFGSYNKKCVPQRTASDWLSYNTKNVDDYIADELCGFKFTLNGFLGLFNIIKQACSKKVAKSVPKKLPVYFVAGKDDPVGNYGLGVVKAYKKLKKAGVEDVTISIFEGARHEILNEACAPMVMKKIYDFMQAKVTND